jgi:hypothetical protein
VVVAAKAEVVAEMVEVLVVCGADRVELVATRAADRVEIEATY